METTSASLDAVKNEPGVDNDARGVANGKRDHLRALLDRARESRGSNRPHAAPNASMAQSSSLAAATSVTIKSEPMHATEATAPGKETPPDERGAVTASTATRIIRLNGPRETTHPEPPAFLPTPRGNTKQPMPEAMSARQSQTKQPIPTRGGLLPTPSVHPSRSNDLATVTAPSYAGEPHAHTSHSSPVYAPRHATSTVLSVPSNHQLHPRHHHHQQHQPMSTFVTPDGHVVYAAPPLSSHAPTCSCAHSYPVHPSYPHEAYDMRWHHYQTSAPPSLTIPAQHTHRPHPHFHEYPHQYNDAGVVTQAVSAQLDNVMAQSISPTMSSTTSSTDASYNHDGVYDGHNPGPSHHPKNTVKRSTTRPRLNSVETAVREDPTTKQSTTLTVSLDEYEDHELHGDFVHTVHMLIPADSFGCLIGPGGESIKQINAASGCTLSVRDATSFPFIEFDRVLRLYGKPKGICLAQRLVIDRIRKHREQKKDTSYVSLDGDPLVPLGENFVTKSMHVAVESTADDEEESEEDVIAESGQLRWLIHMDNVGKIMGSEGRILKAIARDTNTTLKVTPIRDLTRGSSERAVIISGAPDDIKTARAVIEEKAGGRLETHGANIGKEGQYFVIPHFTAGFLIGPQGSRVRKIREETGASIQIPSQEELPLGYLNRTLHIQGRKEQVESACTSIRRRLQSFLRSPDSISVSKEDEIVIQLLLPTRICSSLLDQRGRLIREINEKAGAHARFLPGQDEEHRVCVLYGDMPRVFRAERLVLQFLAGDAIANKRAGTGGAPPRKRKRVNDRADIEEEKEEDDDQIDIVDDSDDDVALQSARGRPRKRRPLEDSDRVVVHFSDPRPPTQRAPRRGVSHPRPRAAKASGPGNRNKRRR